MTQKLWLTCLYKIHRMQMMEFHFSNYSSEHLIFELISEINDLAMQLLAKIGHSFMFQIDANKSSIAIESTHIHLLEHFVHVMNFQIIQFDTTVYLDRFSIWCIWDGARTDKIQIIILKTILNCRICHLHRPLHSYWHARYNHMDNWVWQFQNIPKNLLKCVRRALKITHLESVQ